MADHVVPEELRRAWLQAADSGAVQELRSLLSAHPALLNCRDRHQTLKASTALHLSAWRNHAHVAEFLLKSGANLESRDDAGMTPVQIDILRVCMEKMRPIPLLRARCIDVSSPVAYSPTDALVSAVAGQVPPPARARPDVVRPDRHEHAGDAAPAQRRRQQLQ